MTATLTNTNNRPSTLPPGYRTDLPALPVQQGDAARASWYLKAFRLLARAIFRLLFNVRVSGVRNIPGGQVIVCANHLGWADPFLVLLYFPIEPRIYGLSDHNAAGRTGFRAAMMNFLKVVVTIDPGKPVPAVRVLQDVIERGGSLMIFPEGAPPEQPEEGKLRPLYNGAARLSAMYNIPIVPVGIRGTKTLWLRRRLRMRVGKPIRPGDFEGDERVRSRAMTGRLREEILALIPPHQPQRGPRLLSKWLTNVFA